MKGVYQGIVPPIVTPVDTHCNVYRKGLCEVLDYVLDGGVHGIFVNGSNGEFYGLDHENQRKAIEYTVDHVNGRVPVYAGASAITTKEAILLAKEAESAGANLITVLTPMFIQPNEDELYTHFKTIAESVNLPVILYNNPGKTGNNITPGLFKRLLQIESIIGIKNTSMDFSQTMKYLSISMDKETFHVFGGIDYYVYATLLHGGSGSVAGTANVAPKLVVDIFNRYIENDGPAALEAQNKLMIVRDMYEFGTFPVMMKVCLNLLGMDAGHPIAPVQDVSDAVKIRVKRSLKELGLL